MEHRPPNADTPSRLAIFRKRWKEEGRIERLVKRSSTLWIGEDFDEALVASDTALELERRFREDAQKHALPKSKPVPQLPPPGWPQPMGEDAFHGPAGEIVRDLLPYTEASPEALLVDLLTTFGLMVGKGPYYRLSASEQQPRLFTVIVGDTARGRKGAARSVIDAVTRTADKVPPSFIDVAVEPWTKGHTLKGLNSGEGLISAIEGAGVDGRMLIIEEEFYRLMVVAAREGQTLSPLIREAYDHNSLRVANKNSPISTSNAYVAIIGNITQGELVAALGGRNVTETLNGFGNRFLYIASRRTKLIPPSEARIPDAVISKTSQQLGDALRRARKVEEMVFAASGKALSDEWYYNQTGAEGLFGSMTTRLDVHGLRVAMIYALLDGSKLIRADHVKAASEVIRYAEASAKYVLGDATGNAVADRILMELRLPVIDQANPANSREQRGRMSRRELFDLFKGHVTREELDQAIALLVSAGAVREIKEATGGAPRQVVELI